MAGLSTPAEVLTCLPGAVDEHSLPAVGHASPAPVQRTTRPRYAIGFFAAPDWDAVVECVPSCLSAGTASVAAAGAGTSSSADTADQSIAAAARYPPMTYYEWRKQRIRRMSGAGASGPTAASRPDAQPGLPA